MYVAGVDGCKGGWLLVRADATGQLRIEDVSVISTFRELIAATAACAAVAVDIPIGLGDDKPRAADGEARQVLREPRRRSVFPTPVRPTLKAETHDEAKKLSLLASGKSMNVQTFNILKKIREADKVMTPLLQEWIVEVHPEVSFWALNDKQSMRHKKKSKAGKQERLQSLSRVFVDDLACVALPLRKDAGLDDFYDACVAAWTAGRIAYGTALRLPAEPLLDSHGLRMEIVY
ncbi:MAG: DUF429 domain-containing protein [Chloroflexi bacterium]|nr:DUF429 domain-containing protein [Chloroflexota bacterium]